MSLVTPMTPEAMKTAIEPEELTLESFKAELNKTAVFTFDIEHDPEKKHWMKDFDLWGSSFAAGDRVWWVINKELGMAMYDYAFSLEKTADGRDVEAVAYNGKYDLKCLRAAGWIKRYPANFRDPMIAVNLLDDNRKPNKLGLDVVVKDFYGYQMMDFKTASIGGPRSALFRKYATDDSIWELKLYNDLKPKLIAENLWNYFIRILSRVCKPFADMEHIGIQWNLAQAKKLLVGFGLIRDELELEIIGELGPINLNSPDQLANRLFNELGYSTKGIPMTKSGKRFAVDEAAMEILAQKFPICKKMVAYRTSNKMIGTYVEPNTRRALDDPNGRIHPTIWVVSATGRTRMSDPNFQNLPAYLADIFKELKIRSCVVAAPGKVLVAADLSQIELRLAAHITQDPTFLKAYRDWECTACKAKGSSIDKLLHSCPSCGQVENEDILKTCPKCKRLHIKYDKKLGMCPICKGEAPPDAYESLIIKGFWHGLDLHQMTADAVPALHGERPYGKTANFALIYCAGGYRMHMENPDMSVEEWEVAIEQYMMKYAGVRQWHIRMERALKETGICTDIFGRKRRIPRRDIHISFKHSLNQFVNFPVQSSGVGLIMLALIKLYERWLEKGWWLTKIFFSNFVHDELCFEIDPDILEEAKFDIRDCMENAVSNLRVPIRTDIKVVNNWAEAKG